MTDKTQFTKTKFAKTKFAKNKGQLSRQKRTLKRRTDELNTIYRISTMLSATGNLQKVLDDAARNAATVMKVKAVSIRLLDEPGKELLVKSVYNLSQAYLDKGPIAVAQSELYQKTLQGQVVYVKDMASDPRILYPEFAKREGLVSILSAPMTFHQRPIGVIRLYTGIARQFSQADIDLLKTVAQLLAVGIATARLNIQQVDHERVQRQLKMASAVQRRMLPKGPPHIPPFDLAARYVPSLELGGDFYDFIRLDEHMGVAVGDVVGKGVAASLLMASVRASLRAYAQDVYDIDEVIARVNVALTRDTLDNEFATLFYGVLDPATLRFTYCNAGHEVPLLLRDGQLIPLETGGMIVGVDSQQAYDKGLLDLQAGDMILIYTDGLVDAQNFDQQRFGRDRIVKAINDAADLTAEQAVNHILWEMRRFVGLNRHVDDTTLVVIKVDQNAQAVEV